MFAAVGENQSGSDNQIFHSSGDQDLVGQSLTLHAGANVNCHATYFVAQQFAFANMHARPDLHAKSCDGVFDRQGALHGPSRTVKRCKETISGIVDLVALKTTEFATDEAVMSIQKVVPFSVAHLDRMFGRIDDVGENNRCKNAIKHRDRFDASEKLLNLERNFFLAITRPWNVVRARKLS